MLQIYEDLTLKIGRERVRVSPRQGLHLAEKLARASFRRALSEEADALAEGEPAEVEELPQ